MNFRGLVAVVICLLIVSGIHGCRSQKVTWSGNHDKLTAPLRRVVPAQWEPKLQNETSGHLSGEAAIGQRGGAF